MRFMLVLAVCAALFALLPAFTHAALVGNSTGTFQLGIGDWVEFQSDLATDRSCPTKNYALKFISINDEATTYFELNCTKPVNVYHQHPPFFWYNTSVELYQYGAYNEFLGVNVRPSNSNPRAQTTTLTLAPFQATATPTPEPSNFTRYCPNPSTEEGTCSFNYKYCRPGTLDFVCDCTKCPVPNGAISPCNDICNPPTPTPTSTPLATLPPATPTPGTATSTSLPSAVTGQPTPGALDNSGTYWLAGGIILLVLVGLAFLSQGPKPPKPAPTPHARHEHGAHAV